MRFIPTRIHGIIDYVVGALLILAPFIFGFATGGAEMWVPIVVGVGTILYSLFTNYELGVMRTLSMRSHLWLDGIMGAFLAVSPWLFGFSEIVWVPHVVVGLLEIGAALMTKTVPAIHEPERRRHRTTAPVA